jgi:hypothetical protein
MSQYKPRRELFFDQYIYTDGYHAPSIQSEFHKDGDLVTRENYTLAIETLRILWQTADTEHLSDELKEQVKKVLGE